MDHNKQKKLYQKQKEYKKNLKRHVKIPFNINGKKGKKGKNARKDADDEDDDDDDLGGFDDEDGKIYKQCKYAFCYAVKWRCMVGASFKNIVTVSFGILMMINAVAKAVFKSSIDDFIAEDMTEEFVEFDTFDAEGAEAEAAREE